MAARCSVRAEEPATAPVASCSDGTGAGGGLGSMAIAILAKLGYHVVASTGRPDELGGALRADADASRPVAARFADLVAAIAHVLGDDDFVWVDLFAVRQWAGAPSGCTAALPRVHLRAKPTCVDVSSKPSAGPRTRMTSVPCTVWSRCRSCRSCRL